MPDFVILASIGKFKGLFRVVEQPAACMHGCLLPITLREPKKICRQDSFPTEEIRFFLRVREQYDEQEATPATNRQVRIISGLSVLANLILQRRF